MDRGKNLIAMDAGGSSDPYVKLWLDASAKKQKHKTDVIRRTVDPDWNRSFSLPVEASEGRLHIQVWDWEMLSRNDFMGGMSFDVHDLFEDNPVPAQGAW